MTRSGSCQRRSCLQRQDPLSGIVLTKLDGDSRGGAALSIRAATGVPVKLAGVGEKVTDIEQFDSPEDGPTVLGMGDVQGW
jgi:signal recognition particle subunit SRP54